MHWSLQRYWRKLGGNIRERICRDAAWLGIKLDEAANAAGQDRISSGLDTPSVWVVPTDEEQIIAMYTQDVLDRELAAA